MTTTTAPAAARSMVLIEDVREYEGQLGYPTHLDLRYNPDPDVNRYDVEGGGQWAAVFVWTTLAEDVAPSCYGLGDTVEEALAALVGVLGSRNLTDAPRVATYEK